MCALAAEQLARDHFHRNVETFPKQFHYRGVASRYRQGNIALAGRFEPFLLFSNHLQKQRSFYLIRCCREMTLEALDIFMEYEFSQILRHDPAPNAMELPRSRCTTMAGIRGIPHHAL
jgi:hypothetical protein